MTWLILIYFCEPGYVGRCSLLGLRTCQMLRLKRKKKKRNWKDTAEGRRLRVAHVSVVGDVGDCVGHCVYTLRVLVRNFDGEFFLDGENNLGACA
jgi:hypothetical protein